VLWGYCNRLRTRLLAARYGRTLMCSQNHAASSQRSLTTVTKLGLAVLVLSLLTSCGFVPRPTLMLDRSIPHRLTKPVRAEVEMRTEDGLAVAQVVLDEGWWVIAPELLRSE